MQQRRRTPIIILAFLVFLFIGAYGLSYVWTPKPASQSETISLDAARINDAPKPAAAAVEYP